MPRKAEIIIIDQIIHKECNDCKRFLPQTEEHYHKDKSHYDGLSSKCRDCRIKATNDYRLKNLKEISERKKVHYEQNKSQYATRNKKYREENVVMLKEKYDDNLEKRRAWGKSWKERNKERYREQYIENYHRNRSIMLEKAKLYRDRNKELLKRKTREYHKKNPLIKRLSEAKRRAIKSSLPYNYSEVEWKMCKEYFNNECAYCGQYTKELDQEHFIPVKEKGEYTVNNIIPACRRCNPSKNAKDFFEWYPKQPYYSRKKEIKILEYLGYSKENKKQQLSIF